MRDTAPVEVVVTEVRGLCEHDLRVVDIDVTGWASGNLEASIVRDGAPVTAGTVIVHEIAASGAPLPELKTTLNLRFDGAGRVLVTLPPAQYFAYWTDHRAQNVPLGEFTIRSGESTRADFVVDLVPVSLRLVEADGTPAAATASVRRAGWASTPVATDTAGLATIAGVRRGDTVQVGCCRRTGAGPNGVPAYGPFVELGTVRAGEAAGTIEFRLPAR